MLLRKAGDVLDTILIDLINSFIEGAGELLNDILVNLTEIVFYSERDFTSLTGNALDFGSIFDLFLNFAVSLIILKFLKKGFDIYIGWYDGDKDANPVNLAVNFARAIITALSFSFLYGVLVDIVKDFMENSLFALVSLGTSDNLAEVIMNLFGNVLFWAISGLVLVICYCILWIKFLVLGVEMLVLRMGFPLACIGLLDSDKGVFAPYLKKLFTICMTAVVQIFLLRLSLVMIGSAHMVWGLAFCFGAMKTPKMLNDFMFAYSSGGLQGALSTGYYLSSIVRMIKR